MALRRIVIADSREIGRRGLRGVFEHADSTSVAGEAETAAEASQLVTLLEPDVLILALVPPIEPCLDLLGELATSGQGVQTVVISPEPDFDLICRALRRGAAAFLLSDADISEVVRAVNDVGPDRTVLDARISALLVEKFISDQPGGRTPERSLTPRQQEVLQLLAEGHASKQIATRLHISSRTVDTHRHQIMQKLKLRGIADLTRFAIRHGLAELETPARESRL